MRQEYPSLGYFSSVYNVKYVPKFTGTKEQKILQEFLRVLRVEAGFTQIDLARSLGQPQSYISKYESGERRLDFLEVRHLCENLGISISDFTKRLEELISES